MAQTSPTTRGLDFPQPSPLGVHGEFEAVPVTNTPPFGETPIYDEPDPFFTAPPVEIGRDDPALLHARINVAFPKETRNLQWWNDDQLGGTAVPPGHPNAQPFMSGHTQIVVHNPAAEQGWGADPAFRWPRYPYQGASFPGYSAGIHRRNGSLALLKFYSPLWHYTQQRRDLMLRKVIASRKGSHGTVVGAAPTVPFTENVAVVEPGAVSVDTFIGLEGVLPG